MQQSRSGRSRRGIFSRREKRAKGGFGETARTVAWALLLALGVRTFLFEPFHIPSGSMIPTLLVGDYMFVSKMAYGYGRYSFPFGIIPIKGRIFGSLPERGDVAVFRNPMDTREDYVKRVIGLPGDSVQMIGGRLHINDVQVPRGPVEGPAPAQPYIAAGQVRAMHMETLPGGVAHPIIEAWGDSGPLDNTPRFVVPADHVFVMGDNRDNSSDSRVMSSVGFVPVANLVGKASFLFYSVDESVSLLKPWTWPAGARYGRLLNSID